MSLKLLRFAMMLGSIAMAAHVQAANKTWLSGGGANATNWNRSQNWSPSGAPGAADDIIIPTTPSNGSGFPVLNASSTIATLTIQNGASLTGAAGQSLTISGDATITGTLNVNASTMSVGGALSGAGTVNGNTGTLNLQGDMTVTTFNRGTGTVVYNGTAAQSLGAYTYNNLTISNTSATVSAPSNFAVNATFSMNGAATVLSPSAAVIVGGTGTLTGSGTVRVTRTAATADFSSQYTISNKTLTNLTVEYSGAAAQQLSAITYGSLTINNPSGVTLAAGNATATGVLTLESGVVSTGSNTLITSANCPASVSRTDGHVAGMLRLQIPTGSPSCTFDVGDASGYRPIELAFSSVTVAGNLTGTVSQSAGDHPNIATVSVIDPNFTVNRYWTLTNGGVTGTYSATFTFLPADLDPDAVTGNFVLERFAGGTWNATTVGTRTATTTQATGLIAFGDFQIGEGRPSAGASSFNAVEVGAGVLTNIRTKVAGSIFSLDLVALNAARNGANTAFKGPVTVELLNSSNNAGGLDANGCRNTWVSIQSFTTTFAASENGRHTTSFTENNIFPDARVRVKYSIGGTDLLIGCSVDNFAIRPSTFDNVAASDLDWENSYVGVGTARNLTNTATSGGVVHKAGRTFTVSARAVNSLGSGMATYAGSPVAVTTIVTPAGGANGSLTFTSWSASSGTVTSTNAVFSEAGVVTMRLEDQSYANVDASDGISTTGDRYVVGPDFNIGRFVPDHFTFTGPNTPSLQTFGGTCAGARSFTYVGQPFWYPNASLPSARIEARNAANAVTQNYRGTLFKLAASGIGETYSNNGVGPALIVGASVSPPQLSVGSGPGNDGTATYTAAASATDVNLTYTRDAATPIVPFTANISLTVTASDSSESGVTGNGTITAAPSLTFSSIAFDSGNEFRYGRARLMNAAGPTTVDIPLTLRAEYYLSAAAGFVTNTADNCTPLAVANFKLSGHAGSLTGTDVAVSVPARLTLGIASGMKLTKSTTPVSGPGLVRVCFDLDSAPNVGDTACAAGSSANRSYLQGPWSGAGSYDKDPGGQVNVGTFGAQPNNFIFFRENY